MITALNSSEKKAVLDKISAHAKVFQSKSSEEQLSLTEAAKAATQYLSGGLTRLDCPACKCSARGIGEWVRDSRPFYDDNERLSEKHVYATRRYLNRG